MVYCKKCRHVFPEYKVVGQRIKDAAQNLRGDLLKTTVKIHLEKPLAVLMGTQHWEARLEPLVVAEICCGSRRNALNLMKFPCPICREFVHWKRGSRGGDGETPYVIGI